MDISKTKDLKLKLVFLRLLMKLELTVKKYKCCYITSYYLFNKNKAVVNSSILIIFFRLPVFKISSVLVSI